MSEAYREIHKRSWGAPSTKDFVEEIVDSLATNARFEKAVQSLREDNLLTTSTSDIGAIMKGVAYDLREEEGEAIEKAVIKHLGLDKIVRTILKGACKRIPSWYKEKLLKEQFDGE